MESNRRLIPLLVQLTLLSLQARLLTAHAQGTAFTYQGQLKANGQPTSGLYDFNFQLFDAATGGNSYGGTVSTNGVPVANGLFTVPLDFGNQFSGAARWLEIAVRTNGAAALVTLAPRQPLTPAPYSVFAQNVGSGGLASGTYPNAVTLNNPANSFSGNGGGLTTLNASQLATGTVPAAALGNAWTTTGNSGTTPGANFLGTTDATPLDFWAGGARGLELRDGSRLTGVLSFTEGMNVIGGSSSNYVDAGLLGATIAGGGYSYGTILSPTYVNNSIYSDLGAIGGGSGNVIGLNSPGSVVAGGSYNADWNGSTNSFIGGGNGNQVYSPYSLIAGGNQNTIGSYGQYNVIGGGSGNLVQQSANAVVLAGGIGNFAGPDGSGTAYASVVSGGHNNNADGDYSVVPGGDSNWSPGAYSFAAGRRAKATKPGEFVWADSQDADFFPLSLSGITSNVFCVRSQYGVYFTSDSAGTYNAFWSPGSGSWSFVSDRAVKENFTSVDPGSVLDKVSELPISEWSYKGFSTRHIGPMAQDFHALFPLNESDTTLNELDLHGVELTAIKGLNRKVEDRGRRADVRSQESESRIQKLESENVELRARLEKLEQLVSGKSGGAK